MNYMTKEGKELLVYKRRLHGFKQQDMASLLNITISAYNKKENGKKDWKNSERIIIIKHLKINDVENKIIFGA